MLIMNENEKRLLEVTIASEDDLPFTIREVRYELILHQCNGEDIMARHRPGRNRGYSSSPSYVRTFTPSLRKNTR